MAMTEETKNKLHHSISNILEDPKLVAAVWASSTEDGEVAKSFIGEKEDLMALIMICIVEIVSRVSKEEGIDTIDKTIQILKAIRTANGGDKE